MNKLKYPQQVTGFGFWTLLENKIENVPSNRFPYTIISGLRIRSNC